MNREQNKEQIFFTELEDPNIVAALAAMGFKVKGGAAVDLKNLDSQHDSRKGSRAWSVATVSEKHGLLTAFTRVWDKPLPCDAVATLPPAMLCKLVLHNRRVLQVFLQRGGELHYKQLGAFGRLGNFGMNGSQRVEELPDSDSALLCWDTLGAAAAITLGHPLGGFVCRAGSLGWLVLPGDANTPFTVADVLGLLGDAEAIQRRDDAAALAVATLRNRDFLVRGADRAGKIKVFHKNGRYAVLAGNARQSLMVAAARHLNT
jgi:hypothetical protein